MIDFVKWDSDFFQLRIGKINPGNFDLEEFLLGKDSYDLIYISEKSDNLNRIDAIQSLNLEPIDIKLIYSKEILHVENVNDIHEYGVSIPSDKLIRLSLQAGIYSRFYIDQNFKIEQYNKLYSQWIESSVAKSLADFVFINGSEDSPNGFITLKLDKGFTQIGLIAVDDSQRGQGIGKKLIQKTEYVSKLKGYSIIKVVTQKGNASACKFYEYYGFGVEESINIYHYWNKQSANVRN